MYLSPPSAHWTMSRMLHVHPMSNIFSRARLGSGVTTSVLFWGGTQDSVSTVWQPRDPVSDMLTGSLGCLWVADYSSTVIAATGHDSAASLQQPAAPQSAPEMTSALPSSSLSLNTVSHRATQAPHPMQAS